MDSRMERRTVVLHLSRDTGCILPSEVGYINRFQIEMQTAEEIARKRAS